MDKPNPILDEIERWQSIYSWFVDQDKPSRIDQKPKPQMFAKEAEHVRDILSKITLGIKLNNPQQEPSK